MQRNQNEKCETWKGEELNCRKQRDLEQRRVKASTSIDDSEETSERVVFACLEREKVMSRNWNGNETKWNGGKFRASLFIRGEMGVKWYWDARQMKSKWSLCLDWVYGNRMDRSGEGRDWVRIASEGGGVEPVDRWGWTYFEIIVEWNEGLESANQRATCVPMIGE